MSRPYRQEPRGNKPMTREYKSTMAFMAATFRDETPLTDEQRDELIRKAGGR